ncbi:uncharacterized protein LOC119262339 [Pygocentrus nattereri]|uniref:uncharacterized protein LOC119262339 n=1 Tax=Pygocentrus nattereri TaxID=42514 RepID=UPI00189197E7|nr:uncharacterized protein LOC119262339 [Pygocentrus nattereri]
MVRVEVRTMYAHTYREAQPVFVFPVHSDLLILDSSWFPHLDFLLRVADLRSSIGRSRGWRKPVTPHSPSLPRGYRLGGPRRSATSPPRRGGVGSGSAAEASGSPPYLSSSPSPPPPPPAPRKIDKGSVLIVGDSIVRYLKVSKAKAKAKANATVACFPGARVLDVARRLPAVLWHRGDPGTVVVHVGTNDTSARRSEVLKEHYRRLLDTARQRTDARIIVSGPLPTYRRGSLKFSRLYALHCWLREWCPTIGVDFVDNWESFRERPSLFHRDGLHPSPLGSTVLSGNIEAVLRRD